MNQILKIVKWTLITLGGLSGLLILAAVIYNVFFYNRELNQIESSLNELDNVEVLEIWGHDDITLEEISARLKIKGKGEIVLHGLSADVFDYPNRVPVTEIGGHSFTMFICGGGVGPGIDIGVHGQLGRIIKKEFKTVKDVVDNYDIILEAIKNLKQSPDINHFETENSETYILVENKKTKDQDPIFNLLGIEDKFAFAKSLKWKKSNCF